MPPILLSGAGWFVLDKPAGLAVHPGPKTPHSLEALLAEFGGGATPVHRLDRDTSGCLLVATKRPALRALAAAFAGRAVEKIYWAAVEHPPAAESGHIEAPLAKHSTAAAGWRMRVDAGGKPAATGWQVLGRRGEMALIAFTPETGRTHQIRVHATLLAPGCAIVGDPVYGRAHAGGMMLHARRLRFPDPTDGDMQTAEAPCPGRFVQLGFPG